MTDTLQDSHKSTNNTLCIVDKIILILMRKTAIGSSHIVINWYEFAYYYSATHTHILFWLNWNELKINTTRKRPQQQI